jgi:hypothetical protein
VVRVPTDVSAIQRARWLSDLSAALEEAQALLWRLAPADLRDAERFGLAARIEAARVQVQSLQLARHQKGFADIPPEWIKSLPWDRRIDDCGV